MKRSNRRLRQQRSTESPCFACCAAHALGVSHIVQFFHVLLPMCNNVHTVEITSLTPCTNSISTMPFQMLPCAVDWAFCSNVCHQLRLVHCLEPIQGKVTQQTTVGGCMAPTHDEAPHFTLPPSPKKLRPLAPEKHGKTFTKSYKTR